MGFRAILLYGDPDYYSRHGFVAAETLGIRTADDMYAAALQVCELQEEALSSMKGRYVEAAVYDRSKLQRQRAVLLKRKRRSLSYSSQKSVERVCDLDTGYNFHLQQCIHHTLKIIHHLESFPYFFLYISQPDIYFVDINEQLL